MSTKMRKLINLFESSSSTAKYNTLKRMVSLNHATDASILTFPEFNNFNSKYIVPLAVHEVSFEIDENYAFLPDGWWEGEDLLEITFYIKDIEHHITKGSHSPMAMSPDEYYGDDELEFDSFVYDVANHTKKLIKIYMVKNVNDPTLRIYEEKIEENIRSDYLSDGDDYGY